MHRHPAKVLESADVRRLIAHMQTTRQPARNIAIILLSFKAGLRACEIAGLEWSMVLDSKNHVATTLAISRHIAKMGHGRSIPIHPDLKAALRALHIEQQRPSRGPVILSQRGFHMTPRSIVNWFTTVYAELGLHGCSSHSGRRTFITRSARLLAKTGGSLRDVQELAGHRSLKTTEGYIEGNRDAQRKLVALV